jgi:hypothetical protein
MLPDFPWVSNRVPALKIAVAPIRENLTRSALPL